MKQKKAALRICSMLLSANLCLGGASAFAAAPGVGAQAAVLMEAGSGRVLYSKNGQKQLPMASTTKIMTAILAIEEGDLNEIVEVDPSASGVEGSSMYLEKNEKISLENLLYGLMLWSGNDAAVAISIHIGGSVEGFVELMNQKARQIGANNTHFCNPNGLPNEDHYTTAEDLGKIACYAMQNETFRQIVSTEHRVIPWQGHEWDRSLRNKNKMLYNYEGANGIKTGYTKAAGRCLVSGALREDIQLVSVVLNAGDMYGDSEALLDYGFEEVSLHEAAKAGDHKATVAVENGTIPDLEVALERDIVIAIRQSELSELETKVIVPSHVQAPIAQGDVIGRVEIYLQGILLGTGALCAQQNIPQRSIEFYFGEIADGWLNWLKKGA